VNTRWSGVNRGEGEEGGTISVGLCEYDEIVWCESERETEGGIVSGRDPVNTRWSDVNSKEGQKETRSAGPVPVHIW